MMMPFMLLVIGLLVLGPGAPEVPQNSDLARLFAIWVQYETISKARIAVFGRPFLLAGSYFLTLAIVS